MGQGNKNTAAFTRAFKLAEGIAVDLRGPKLDGASTDDLDNIALALERVQELIEFAAGGECKLDGKVIDKAFAAMVKRLAPKGDERDMIVVVDPDPNATGADNVRHLEREEYLAQIDPGSAAYRRVQSLAVGEVVYLDDGTRVERFIETAQHRAFWG